MALERRGDRSRDQMWLRVPVVEKAAGKGWPRSGDGPADRKRNVRRP